MNFYFPHSFSLFETLVELIEVSGYLTREYKHGSSSQQIDAEIDRDEADVFIIDY